MVLGRAASPESIGNMDLNICVLDLRFLRGGGWLDLRPTTIVLQQPTSTAAPIIAAARRRPSSPSRVTLAHLGLSPGGCAHAPYRSCDDQRGDSAAAAAG